MLGISIWGRKWEGAWNGGVLCDSDCDLDISRKLLLVLDNNLCRRGLIEINHAAGVPLPLTVDTHSENWYAHWEWTWRFHFNYVVGSFTFSDQLWCMIQSDELKVALQVGSKLPTFSFRRLSMSSFILNCWECRTDIVPWYIALHWPWILTSHNHCNPLNN